MQNPRAGNFNPDTIRVMQGAVDDAWESLRPWQRERMSKSALAVFVLEAAAAGERDRVRLRTVH